MTKLVLLMLVTTAHNFLATAHVLTATHLFMATAHLRK